MAKKSGTQGPSLPSDASSAADGPSPPAESLVTPEIQAEFDRVFGASSATATAEPESPPAEPAPTGSSVPASGPSAADRRREEEEADEHELDAQRSAAGQPGSDDDKDEDAAGEGAGSGQPVPDASAGGKASPEPKGDDELTLPPALRHAARRNNWSDEEIDAFYEADPAMATMTFTNLRRSYNDLNAQFARLGASAAQGQGQTPSSAPPQAPTTATQATEQADGVLAAIYGERLAKLRENFGDEFIEQVVEPMAQRNEQAYRFYQQQEQQYVGQQIGQFFKSLGSEFSDLYGTTGGNGGVTEEQLANRSALANLADQMTAGARVHGIELTVQDALERAHSLYASEHLEAIERKRLTEQVKKRNRGITQRPTQRRTAPAGQPAERSLQSAMDAYATRAAELGIDVGA